MSRSCVSTSQHQRIVEADCEGRQPEHKQNGLLLLKPIRDLNRSSFLVEFDMQFSKKVLHSFNKCQKTMI